MLSDIIDGKPGFNSMTGWEVGPGSSIDCLHIKWDTTEGPRLIVQADGPYGYVLLCAWMLPLSRVVLFSSCLIIKSAHTDAKVFAGYRQTSLHSLSSILGAYMLN